METEVIEIATIDDFARRFALALRPGDAVALKGMLGAGKTTMVRALVRALHGSDGGVSSPTFIFRHSYAGTPLVEHLDLYRIENAAEIHELGIEEAFGADRITLVEWPERAPDLLPAGTITIVIDGSGDGPRTVSIVRPAR